MRPEPILFLPAIIPAAAGMILLLSGVLRMAFPGQRRYCRGPRVRWIEAFCRVALGPWRVFLLDPCGYDLAGLPQAGDPSKGVVCPECGTRSGPVRGLRRSLRRRSRLRVWRLGAVLVAVGVGVGSLPIVRSGAWVHHVPAAALVDLERLPPGEALSAFRRELDERITRGSLNQAQRSAAAHELVRHLRSDITPGNAARAKRHLERLWPTSEEALREALDSTDGQQRRLAALLLATLPGAQVDERLIEPCVESLAHDDVHSNCLDACWAIHRIGAPAIPALERALDGGDEQQRRHAANLLRNLGAPPTEDLLRESVIDLEREHFENGPPGNATSAALWLIDHAAAAEPFLAEALRSPDPQQRLLAAFVAGYGGRTALVDDAAPVLIEALKDNDVWGDARMALPALYRFGPDVIPHLEPLLTRPDRQQQAAADLLIAALTNPDPDRAERERRARLNRLFSSVSTHESPPWRAIRGW